MVVVTSPSVVLFRRLPDRRPEQQARLILDNLDQLGVALEHGAVVLFMDDGYAFDACR